MVALSIRQLKAVMTLHVSDVGSRIHAFRQTFNISTNEEYYGSIGKKSFGTVHTILEKSTSAMIRNNK